MNLIFTIVSLFFCCVAAYFLVKLQKINKELRKENAVTLVNAVDNATSYVVNKALRETFSIINAPKAEGYLVTASSDMPKWYAVWRKCALTQETRVFWGTTHDYGHGYILVKMFEGDNAEENLRKATELCAKLNDKEDE